MPHQGATMNERGVPLKSRRCAENVNGRCRFTAPFSRSSAQGRWIFKVNEVKILATNLKITIIPEFFGSKEVNKEIESEDEKIKYISFLICQMLFQNYLK